MDLLILVAVLSMSLILLAAGAEHVVAHGKLRSSLRAHGLFGPRGIGLIGIGLPALELIAAGGGIGAIAVSHQSGLVVSLIAQTVLFGGFAAYLVMVLRAGKAGVPCACGLGEIPVGRPAIARAAGLALLSAAATLGAATGAGPITLRGNLDGLVAALAGLSFAVLLAILPSTRIDQDTIGSA